MRITVVAGQLALVIEDGETPVEFTVRGQPVTVTPGPAVVVPLARPGTAAGGRAAQPDRHRPRADGTVISAIVPSGD